MLVCQADRGKTTYGVKNVKRIRPTIEYTTKYSYMKTFWQAYV